MSFLENPQIFADGDFKFIKNPKEGYPVGCCRDIKVYFVHYKSNEEAKGKWVERFKRIIWDDIYVIATGHGGLETPELMERFNNLPYKNKIMFTSHAWPEYPWAIQVKVLHEMEHMPPLSEFATFSGKRYYETCFDLVEWIIKYEKVHKNEDVKL